MIQIQKGNGVFITSYFRLDKHFRIGLALDKD